MQKYYKKLAFLMLGLMLAFAAVNVQAEINPKYKQKNKKTEQLQAPYGVYDFQANKVSNLTFYVTNYGIFGLNILRNEGGGYWPRGSRNQYIFGGGVWFGAMKYRSEEDKENGEPMGKLVSVTYNPNSGKSWMVPGRIYDKDGNYTPNIDNNDMYSYKSYISLEYNSGDGTPITDVEAEKNWPIWDTSDEDTLKIDRYLGDFIQNPEFRKTSEYPDGPAFISGEDIFSTYKDTDLSRYEGGSAFRANQGYPLMLQFEEYIYSWGFGDYKDFIFLRYDIMNESTDTLYNCWLAPVMDVDLARAPNTHAGASNDRVRFYDEDSTLNLAAQWTNDTRGEKGYGFGYLGFNFLESPAVIKVVDEEGNELITDSTNFIRRDSKVYNLEEQLGLVTFRNWSIDEDIPDDESRYNFLSLGIREGDTGPGDKRFLMATGPFHMRPKDKVRVVVGIILANTSKGDEADGTEEDMQALVNKVKFAQEVYDNNFKAPVPPSRTNITDWEPLNNGMIIKWDNSAEMSIDDVEEGLDFMGYRLYRARRTNLDTFDLEITKDKGPFGWKQIGEWRLPYPFLKSEHRAGNFETDGEHAPFIDSLRIVGPYDDINRNVIDSMAIRVMRVCNGCLLLPDTIVAADIAPGLGNINPYLADRVVPVLRDIDTSRSRMPWGHEFDEIWQEGAPMLFTDSKGPELYLPDQHHRMYDSVLIGIARLNRALVKYNPLFFDRHVVEVSRAWLDSRLVFFKDGIIGDTITLEAQYDDEGNEISSRDTIRIDIDTVYFPDTFRQATIGGNNTTVCDVLLPLSVDEIMTDTTHTQTVLDSLYAMIQRSVVTIDFPDYEGSEYVRKNVITPYMNLITNDRTFMDVGDDNHNGLLEFKENPAETEKIINNVDYFYRILAFDEGDYQQPTPMKLNDASPGLPNLQKTVPGSPPAGKKASFEIISVDSSKIGGLYNFNFFPIDLMRVNQMFAGHILKLEFEPYYYLNNIVPIGKESAIYFGLYRSLVRLTDTTTGEIIYENITSFETPPCNTEWRNRFTEDAFSYILSDEPVLDSVTGEWNTFSNYNNQDSVYHTGEFTTGNFTTPGYCNNPFYTRKAYGTLGFSFDFSIIQYGGWFRPDSTILENAKQPGTNASTYVNAIFNNGRTSSRVKEVFTTQAVDITFPLKEYGSTYIDFEYASFNNGPGKYLVEFFEGGDTTITVKWDNADPNQTNTFNVPYLNVKVTNLTEYKRPDPVNSDSAWVRYPSEMPHMDINNVPARFTEFSFSTESTTGKIFNEYFAKEARYYPDPRNLAYWNIDSEDYIGRFNIASFGFANTRESRLNSFRVLDNHAVVDAQWDLAEDGRAKKGGAESQGKYLLTAESVNPNPEGQKDIIDFTHILNISGVQFVLDYAKVGWANLETQVPNAELRDRDVMDFGPDFKPGDKLILSTSGGALGLPMSGATVLVKVNESIPETYTDDEIMDDIMVVPNPYYVSHQGQRSPYDAKIYFTRLPRKCTIDIYTVTGDLVETIDHNEVDSENPTKASIQPWDLVSKNGQRVQSQTFVAVISSPDGAQTVKKFTIVVGGFRLIEDN